MRGWHAERYYPRLRHVATVISSDESFVPPSISDPKLVMHASYDADHTVDVNWQWACQVGDARSLAPLYPTPGEQAGYRDLDRERAILADLELPRDEYELLRPAVDRTGANRPLAPHAVLTGLDTMRFATEVLPQLADHSEVEVEVSGDQADYREVGLNLTEADYCFVLDPWWNRQPKRRRWTGYTASDRPEMSWCTDSSPRTRSSRR
ncbi:MAG TPA: hypothetical protein VFT31_00855 [Kribbella sp.]|nr:hypothetical protein [Kribbella sp.]